MLKQEIAQAIAANRAYAKHCEDRLKLGATRVTIDNSGEVTYRSKARDPLNQRPFKPLQEMTMKMLADAVNHTKLKSRIAEEIKSERSSKKVPEDSSSEGLYSDAGALDYDLPQIDPDKLGITGSDHED